MWFGLKNQNCYLKYYLNTAHEWGRNNNVWYCTWNFDRVSFGAKRFVEPQDKAGKPKIKRLS